MRHSLDVSIWSFTILIPFRQFQGSTKCPFQSPDLSIFASSSSFINSSLEVRVREGGEKFCPAGKNRTRSLKKLYQESKIPPWVRDRIPLIYIENKLAAVPGLWISKEFSVPKDEVGVNFIWEDNLGI